MARYMLAFDNAKYFIATLEDDKIALVHCDVTANLYVSKPLNSAFYNTYLFHL